MKITKLSVTNLRAFKRAELEFGPGMNLLVGLNGLGKTTVLDALRIMLSQVLPQANEVRGDSLDFVSDDIRVGTNALSAELNCEVPGARIAYTVHQPRAGHIVTDPGSVRNAITETPKRRRLVMSTMDGQTVQKLEVETQLAAFFSTRRSLASDAQPSKGKSGGERAAALGEALSPRELRLAEMAYWMEAQRQLGAEEPLRLKHLSAVCRAASHFLPECRSLRAETQPKPRLLVDKKRCALDVRQLSDGERGTLALVLDLARRLSQAGPDLDDPIKQGEAVALIDELDLHLHPKWQRTIVERLTRTFPRCQFIATTHSPQVVSAVEPEQVLLLTDKGIVRPERTLGIDSNWILHYLMEDEERPPNAAKAIKVVEALIRSGNFKKARARMAEQRRKGFDLPDWSVLEARMARMEVLGR